MEKRVYPFTRHLHCERCESVNRPFKRQRGITLHLIRLIKTENDEVIYGAVCCICMMKPTIKVGIVEILHETIRKIPTKDWNALIMIDPSKDGFVG